MVAAYPSYLDASVLVKLFLEENGSDVIKNYINANPTSVFYVTSICFAETLGVLKTKDLRRNNPAYNQLCSELLNNITAGRINIKDVGISDWKHHSEILRIAEENELDISDAFQIVTLKHELFSGPSRPLLITADKKLAAVARAEGLRVWNLLQEEAPSNTPQLIKLQGN